MVKRIIKICISFLYIALNDIKKTILKLNNDSCLIFYYHSIPDAYAERFIKQLNYIQKKTTPVSADSLNLSNDNNRYSIITFDDAYQSVLKNALPELYKRKISSIIFAPSGCLGRKPEWLENIDHLEKNEIIATAEQLMGLDNELVLVGSHSCNHYNLATLDESELYHELYESKKQLEKIMSYPILSIAFPFGAYNLKVLEICEKVGYKQVFTTKPYICKSPSHEFEKGRIGINPWDWTVEYRLKILGAYSWMPYASKFKLLLKSLFLRPK